MLRRRAAGPLGIIDAYNNDGSAGVAALRPEENHGFGKQGHSESAISAAIPRPLQPRWGRHHNVTIATATVEGQGERRDARSTEWHRVVFFAPGEIAGEYLKKGRPVYVEGKLRTRK